MHLSSLSLYVSDFLNWDFFDLVGVVIFISKTMYKKNLVSLSVCDDIIAKVAKILCFNDIQKYLLKMYFFNNYFEINYV